MANGLPNPRPKGSTYCLTVSGRNYTHLWGARSITIRQGHYPLIIFDEGHLQDAIGIQKLQVIFNVMVQLKDLTELLRRCLGKFGLQWDQYLSGVLGAYHNAPHSLTGEKSSFFVIWF